ncbi:MAG TPA: 30S ribosome-binding factor RbfA [Egibacteraceae bacterium]|nr:30S ribosome-binding factor RbfA [Egibacteraceae bacterium]
MAESSRIRRVNEAVREVVAEMLPRLKDPRIGFVTLTEVRTSPDLRHARVWYSVLPDTEESRAETAAGLDSASPILRRAVGSRLRLKHVPDLHFTHDPLPAHSERIDTLIRESQPDQGTERE